MKRMSTVLVAVLLGCGEPASGPDEWPEWEFREELRIGSVDDEEYSFFYVHSITVGRDGTLYVLDSRDRLIKAFDHDGRLIWSMGGEGQAPGQLAWPITFGMLRDTLLYSFDMGQGRVNLFKLDGRFAGSISVQAKVEAGSSYRPGPVTRMLDDGSLIALLNRASPDPDLAGRGNPVVRVAADGTVRDTLFWSSEPKFLVLEVPGRRPWPLGQPFADHPIKSWGGSGSSMLTVERPAAEAGVPASFHVSDVTVEGDTVFTRAYAYDPVPIPQAVADSFVETIPKRFPWLVDAFGGPRVLMSAVRDSMYHPAHYPPISDVLRARDGRIWLRRENAPGDSIRWMVLEPRGRPAGTLVLPKSTRIVFMEEDQVWTVEKDELDVQYIHRYRIERRR